MELEMLSGRHGQLTPCKATPGAREGTFIVAAALTLCNGY